MRGLLLIPMRATCTEWGSASQQSADGHAGEAGWREGHHLPSFFLIPGNVVLFRKKLAMKWRDPSGFRDPHRALVSTFPATSHDRQGTAADTAGGSIDYRASCKKDLR